MATSDVPLIDEEVPFSIDELFFSTTEGGFVTDVAQQAPGTPVRVLDPLQTVTGAS